MSPSTRASAMSEGVRGQESGARDQRVGGRVPGVGTHGLLRTPDARPPTPSVGRSAWERLRRRKTAAAGLVILGLLLAGSLAAPLLMGDPNEVDFAGVLQPPSLVHPLGTDQLGRDLLTRVAYGGRISFLIGVLAVALALVAGIPVGVISGYVGGPVDLLVQRGGDLLLALPGFLLPATLIAVLGGGGTNGVGSGAGG